MLINFLPRLGNYINKDSTFKDLCISEIQPDSIYISPNDTTSKVQPDCTHKSLNDTTSEVQSDSIHKSHYYIIAKNIIEPIDTMKFSPDIINTHNESRLSFLKELINNEYTQCYALESTKMQVRLFYVAILSVLVSFLLRGKSLSNKKNATLILMLVILSMYALEMHIHDKYKRSIASLYVKINTSEILMDCMNSYEVRYKLDFTEFDTIVENSAKGSLNRKIKTAFTIEVERSIFYLLPLILLLIYDYKQFKNRQKFMVHHGFNTRFFE